jgi:hypothetical protein
MELPADGKAVAGELVAATALAVESNMTNPMSAGIRQ